MTDYSKMTDEQINEAIFKAKGWVELPPPAAPPWQRPSDGGVESWHSSFPPDYIHDWRLCGELLVEMKTELVYNPFCNQWMCLIKNEWFKYADSPLRAICEAWLDRKE